MIYWDTSVILKLYVDEPDSGEWQELALGQRGPLRSSALMQAEMAHALKQKELRGEVAKGAADELYKLLCEDLQAGRFLLFPVGRDVLEASARRALEGGHLRTLDGLHLATAEIAKCTRIATTDKRLAAAAIYNGMELIDGSADAQ